MRLIWVENQGSSWWLIVLTRGHRQYLQGNTSICWGEFQLRLVLIREIPLLNYSLTQSRQMRQFTCPVIHLLPALASLSTTYNASIGRLSKDWGWRLAIGRSANCHQHWMRLRLWHLLLRSPLHWPNIILPKIMVDVDVYIVVYKIVLQVWITRFLCRRCAFLKIISSTRITRI